MIWSGQPVQAKSIQCSTILYFVSLYSNPHRQLLDSFKIYLVSYHKRAADSVVWYDRIQTGGQLNHWLMLFGFGLKEVTVIRIEDLVARKRMLRVLFCLGSLSRYQNNSDGV